jgi:hypothetical protein
LEENKLLQAFHRGVSFIVSYPRALVAVLVLVLIQTGISLWIAQPLEGTLITGNIMGFIQSQPFPEQVLWIMGLFVSLVIGLYIPAMVSGMVNSIQNKDFNKKSTFVPIVLLSWWIILIGMGFLAFIFLLRLLLVQSSSFFSILGIGFTIVIGIIVFLAVIRLIFTPTLIGLGFTIKEAMRQSWERTNETFWSTVVLLLLLLVVQTAGWAIVGGVIDSFESDMLFVFSAGIVQAILATFTGAVLAFAMVHYSKPAPVSRAYHRHRGL